MDHASGATTCHTAIMEAASDSLSRRSALLEALDSEEVVAAAGNAVGELAATIGRDKSQVSRMLDDLADAGFVERDPRTRRYQLGWRIFGLVERSGDQGLINAVRRVLIQVVQKTGESSHLSVHRGDSALTPLTESPSRSLHTVSSVGRIVATSSGRAVLFDHDREESGRLCCPLPDSTREVAST